MTSRRSATCCAIFSPRSVSILLSAPDGPSCLTLATHCEPDLFLLDITMPQMDGWAVAEALHAAGHRKAKILMLTASALEAHSRSLAHNLHDGYLMKPIDIPRLLGEISRLLQITWKHGADIEQPPEVAFESVTYPQPRYIAELIRLGEMGHVKAVQSHLDAIEHEQPDCRAFVHQCRKLADQFRFPELLSRLRLLQSHE